VHTISFYSYKGGVGRTLVVANVAKFLARFGQKVFAVDFDLEAPGLHYKFAAPEGKVVPRPALGIVDYIHRFVVEQKSPGPIQEYAVRVERTKPGGGDLAAASRGGPVRLLLEAACSNQLARAFLSSGSGWHSFFSRVQTTTSWCWIQSRV